MNANILEQRLRRNDYDDSTSSFSDQNQGKNQSTKIKILTFLRKKYVIPLIIGLIVIVVSTIASVTSYYLITYRNTEKSFTPGKHNQ